MFVQRRGDTKLWGLVTVVILNYGKQQRFNVCGMLINVIETNTFSFAVLTSFGIFYSRDLLKNLIPTQYQEIINPH